MSFIILKYPIDIFILKYPININNIYNIIL